MTHYLIEYRFQGKMKAEIKQMIFGLDNKFNLGYFQSKRPIPHISLAGPLTTNHESRLIKDFTTLCKSTPFCWFKINGFGYFQDSRVVYIHIDAGEKLDEFRWNLAQNLMPYCKLKDFDCKKDFKYHATLAMKLDHQDFRSVKNYIVNQDPLKRKQFLIRATIIKNNRILYEYDFLQRKLLNRTQALDKNKLAHTMKLLDDFFKGKYDPDTKLNIKTPYLPQKPTINILIHSKSKKSGMIKKFLNYFRKILR